MLSSSLSWGDWGFYIYQHLAKLKLHRFYIWIFNRTAHFISSLQNLILTALYLDWYEKYGINKLLENFNGKCNSLWGKLILTFSKASSRIKHLTRTINTLNVGGWALFALVQVSRLDGKVNDRHGHTLQFDVKTAYNDLILRTDF